MNLRLAAVAVGVLASGTLAQSQACWETNYGTALAPLGGSDDGLAPITLPFNFPLPGGGTTNQIQASTNGFLWLDGTSTDNSTQAQVGGATGLLALAPRICVGYADLDLNPSDAIGNGLYANTSFATRAVVTFVGNDYGASPLNKVVMQAQLFVNGSFVLSYRQVDPYLGTSTAGSRDMLVGVSQGGGATSAGEVDFSAGPVMGGTNPTIFEFFPNPNLTPSDPRDLDTIPALLFFPNGTGSYNVAPLTCDFARGTTRGTGCPPAGGGGDGYLFEFFSGGTFDLVGQTILYQRQPSGGYLASLAPTFVWDAGYSNRIDTAPGIWASDTGDDSVSIALPLGFAASYWDSPPITEAYVASNGRVYLAAGGSTMAAPAPGTLNSGPCCVALWSDDLDCRPSSIPATGGLYVDSLTAPNRLVVTFDQIPIYTASPISGETVTGQVQLFQSGDVLVSIMSHWITGGGYCGFFRGKQSGTLSVTTDETDLSTALVAPGLTIGLPVEAMTHDADPGVLGSSPIARAGKLPPGTLGTVLHLGADQVAVPLDGIGMTGCTAYTSVIVAAVPMAQLGNTAATGLGVVPNVPALVGGTLTTQALSFTPGVNPLQLVTSNGWDWVFGTN